MNRFPHLLFKIVEAQGWVEVFQFKASDCCASCEIFQPAILRPLANSLKQLATSRQNGEDPRETSL